MPTNGENPSESAALTGALALFEASTGLDPAGSRIAAKRVVLADLILDQLDAERLQRGISQPVDRSPLLLACLLADVGRTVLRQPASAAAAAGAGLLRSVPALAAAADAVASRYEHVDGQGLPAGLSGSTIPLGSRLLALVDLLASQPALPQLGWPRRLEMMKDAAGTTLDLDLAQSASDVLKAVDVRQRVDRCTPADAIAILSGAQSSQLWAELATVVEGDSDVVSAAQVLTTAVMAQGAPYVATGVYQFVGPQGELVAQAGDPSMAWEPPDQALVSELRSLAGPRTSVFKKNAVTVVPVRSAKPWGVAWAVHGATAPVDNRPLQNLAAALETIVERRHKLERLDALAHKDALTSLPNRRALDAALKDLFDAPRIQRLDAALIMCDIDGLKRVNDTRGHAAGDDVLRAVAGVLSDLVSDQDGFSARLGGDEFCVLLRSGGLLHAQRLARQAAAGVRSVAPASVGLSCGIAFAAHLTSPSELLGRADEAQYIVKRRQPAPSAGAAGGRDRRRHPDR